MIIDFHSHVLPYIDDGSKSVDTSIQMLRSAAEQQINLIILTPHFYASQNTVDAFLHCREMSYASLLDGLAGTAGSQASGIAGLPQLRLGAEVAYFRGIGRAERIRELTIQGTDILLLELPFEVWDERVIKDVEDLIKKRALRVMLAHLERYMGNRVNRRYLEVLLEMPLLVQINAESLISSSMQRRKLIRMFLDDEAHLLGSDCHGMHHRPPNLKTARDVLLRKCGQHVLDVIDERGADILEG